MTTSDQHSVEILPADDGTGDGLIPLSDVLLSSLGWAVDDQIEVTLLSDGRLQLERTESHEGG